jgi:hypothetical protein
MERYLGQVTKNMLLEQGNDRKIMSRTQREDNGKYSFVNRIIKLWNQLPAEVLATFAFTPHSLRKRVRSVSK